MVERNESKKTKKEETPERKRGEDSRKERKEEKGKEKKVSVAEWCRQSVPNPYTRVRIPSDIKGSFKRRHLEPRKRKGEMAEWLKAPVC